MQEGPTQDELAQVTWIYASLEQCQAKYQSCMSCMSFMTEIEGEIFMNSILVLIDPGACHSYISPIIVEKCKLQKVKSPNHG